MIACHKSCCVKVGLESETNYIRLGYAMTIGPLLLTGAFFGPESVIEHMKEHAHELTMLQQNDMIKVMRDLKFL